MTCDKCGYDIQIGDFPFCKGNPADHGTTYSKSQVFPFESRHVAPDGKPLIIESMQHLRKVEKQYGVAFSAFNNEVNNSVDPLKGNLPRYRGLDEDFRR
jgi:hypothetical protein